MSRRVQIAVVGSGSAGSGRLDQAAEVGRLVAENGWILITGGRNAGVMKAANEAAKEILGSLTVGILPDDKIEICPAVDVVVITQMGEARNNVIVASADVVIACGAEDPGTVSEVALAIKANKPVVLLDSSQPAADLFGSMGGRVYTVRTPETCISIVREIVGSRDALATDL